MSQDQNIDNDQYKLIEDVPEYISTDVVTDIKNGIYNLFISLYRSLIPQYGPEGAMIQATSYLDSLSNNFKEIITNKEL